MKNLIAIGMLLAAAGAANAQLLYNAGGFEAPRFTAGNIDLQDAGAWTVDPAGHTDHVVVSGPTLGATPFGGQMVRLNANAAGARFSWADVTAGVAGRTAGNDFIYTSTKIFMPLAADLPANANGVFGLLAFNAAAGNLGGVRVRLSDGAIIGTLDPDGPGASAFNNYTFGPAAVLSRGAWHEIAFGINIVNRALTIVIDGAVFFTGTTSQTAALTLTDVDYISSISGTVAGSVLVDDYSVEAIAAIPTPGAAALLGLGGLAAARRRRAR